jgi:uncharacterized protein (TIGR02722 family)
MKSKYFFLTILFAFFLTANGCNSVKRVDPGKQTDLSGNWNDTDAAQASKTLSADMLARPWADIYFTKTGRKPVIIVGSWSNGTSEHINTDIIIQRLERELLNSGKARIVSNKELRKELRDEIKDQQSNASEETMKRTGKSLGADFMLFGSINSMVDRRGGTMTRNYIAEARLIDIETGETVWIGNWEAKKIIKR